MRLSAGRLRSSLLILILSLVWLISRLVEEVKYDLRDGCSSRQRDDIPAMIRELQSQVSCPSRLDHRILDRQSSASPRGLIVNYAHHLISHPELLDGRREAELSRLQSNKLIEPNVVSAGGETERGPSILMQSSVAHRCDQPESANRLRTEYGQDILPPLSLSLKLSWSPCWSLPVLVICHLFAEGQNCATHVPFL